MQIFVFVYSGSKVLNLVITLNPYKVRLEELQVSQVISWKSSSCRKGRLLAKLWPIKEGNHQILRVMERQTDKATAKGPSRPENV